MQAQIYKDDWHWMMGFGHLAPVLTFSNKTEIKSTGYFKSGHRVPASDSQKAVMIKEIKRLLSEGITKNIDIYYELEGLGVLPEFNGKLFSEHTLSSYITQAKRDLFPDNKQVQEHIVSMFRDGIGRKEIEVKLRTSSQYIRQCLIRAGLIDKRKSTRVYTKKNERNQRAS